MPKLNFGCGWKRLEGWVNIDCRRDVADVVVDMNRFPYPFRASYADVINCDNVLEHLEKPTKAVQEFHRILKPKGKAVIQVPHFTCGGALNGDNHIRAFGVDFFYNFLKGERDNYAAGCSFSKVRCKVIFPHGIQFWNCAIEWLVNISRRMQEFYEHSFLRIFPAEQLFVEMEK